MTKDEKIALIFSMIKDNRLSRDDILKGIKDIFGDVDFKTIRDVVREVNILLNGGNHD
jgi:hypothetical protein